MIEAGGRNEVQVGRDEVPADTGEVQADEVGEIVGIRRIKIGARIGQC